MEQLRISYANGSAMAEPVLRDLDFGIARGEIVGIFGASGSGKTTLARAILRMLPASALMHGSILLGGENLLELSMSAIRKIRGRQISLIPQEPSVSLNPFLKIGKQIDEVICAHRDIVGEPLRQQALALLHLFFPGDVDRISEFYPHQLCGGERQRVVICQSIAGSASLSVADEPSSAMDSITQKAFLDLLLELRQSRRISIILISHNLAALRYVADRELELREGRLHQ